VWVLLFLRLYLSLSRLLANWLNSPGRMGSIRALHPHVVVFKNSGRSTIVLYEDSTPTPLLLLEVRLTKRERHSTCLSHLSSILRN
jgi:hypothetical protein